MNKKEITEYREYLIEIIRVNRIMFNELNEGDWEEDGYSSEEDMESMCKLYGDTTNILERSLETFDKIFGIDDTDDRVSFAIIDDAYDYYWDQSRNPNGNWETEQALDDGELEFCVKMGLSLDEWIKCRNENNK
jgi:hypothetical protein